MHNGQYHLFLGGHDPLINSQNGTTVRYSSCALTIAWFTAIAAPQSVYVFFISCTCTAVFKMVLEASHSIKISYLYPCVPFPNISGSIARCAQLSLPLSLIEFSIISIAFPLSVLTVLTTKSPYLLRIVHSI